MKLFTNPVAPNPVKVELYLAEKAAAGCEVPLERKIVNLIKGEHHTPEFHLLNPLERTPVLQLDDGSSLYESLAIIEYFEEIYPEPSLIGNTPEKRARVRAIERIIDLDILATIGTIVHATNSPVGYPASPELVKRTRPRLDNSLKIINEQLDSNKPFIMGASPTIADCTLGAAMQFARFGGVEISDDFKNILDWDRNYRARDVIAAIILR